MHSEHPEVTELTCQFPRRQQQAFVTHQIRYPEYQFTRLARAQQLSGSTQLEIVPTDRLRPIQGSDFHGFQIDKEVSFPFAIVRRPDAKLWLWQKSSNKLIDAVSNGWPMILSSLKSLLETGKPLDLNPPLIAETEAEHGRV